MTSAKLLHNTLISPANSIGGEENVYIFKIGGWNGGEISGK